MKNDETFKYIDGNIFPKNGNHSPATSVNMNQVTNHLALPILGAATQSLPVKRCLGC